MLALREGFESLSLRTMGLTSSGLIEHALGWGSHTWGPSSGSP